MPRIAAFFALAAVLAGCASIPDEERALLTGDIDCDAADAQIAALDTARPSEARKARVLASSLVPAGIVYGIATNDFGDRERILSGEYDEEIDARVAEIREACGFPTPEG